MAWQPLPSLAAAVKLGEDRTAVQELLARTHQTNKTVHSVPLQELPPELQLACAAKFGEAFSWSQEESPGTVPGQARARCRHPGGPHPFAPDRGLNAH